MQKGIVLAYHARARRKLEEAIERAPVCSKIGSLSRAGVAATASRRRGDAKRLYSFIRALLEQTSPEYQRKSLRRCQRAIPMRCISIESSQRTTIFNHLSVLSAAALHRICRHPITAEKKG